MTCRMALDKAVADGLILKNPAANCKAPATHPREMAVLTGEEIQRLLIQAKEDGCYELLLLELSTGLRRGEILALQWDDLDFRTGALRVQRQVQRIKGELVISQPKTKTSSRSVILPEPTQLGDRLWEGRYSPKVNGKRIARNVYAPTEEECEQKLTELIQEMKRELEPLRGRKTAC